MKSLDEQALTPNERLFLAGQLERFELYVLTENAQEMINILRKVDLDTKQAKDFTQKLLADPRKYGFCQGGCLRRS